MKAFFFLLLLLSEISFASLPFEFPTGLYRGTCQFRNDIGKGEFVYCKSSFASFFINNSYQFTEELICPGYHQIYRSILKNTHKWIDVSTNSEIGGGMCYRQTCNFGLRMSNVSSLRSMGYTARELIITQDNYIVNNRMAYRLNCRYQK